MYDFFVGLAFGVLFTRVFTNKKKKNSKDASTQIIPVQVSIPAPVSIPGTRKSFVPGVMANFWGKDS
jgi:hypothetical protein